MTTNATPMIATRAVGVTTYPSCASRAANPPISVTAIAGPTLTAVRNYTANQAKTPVVTMLSVELRPMRRLGG